MSDAEGLIAKFQGLKGVTPKGVLDHPIRLPAVVGNIGVDEEASHSEYTTVADGQFSMAQQGGGRARMLRSISGLEALALDYDAPWLVEQGLDPIDVRNRLIAILRSHKAVLMSLTLRWGEKPLVEMPVTFRSARWELRQGENDTLYYVVAIKEWRKPGIEREDSEKASRKPEVKFPTTKKLDSNDTLQSLAHDYYGRYDFWRDIRDANGITNKFGQNAPLVSLKRFHAGSVIKLPKVATSSSASKTVGALGTKVSL